MKNPYFKDGLPSFKNIKIDKITHIVEEALNSCKFEIETILSVNENPTWNNFVYPLSLLDNYFYVKVWGPISHLSSVKDSDELRKIIDICSPKISEYTTWIGQNRQLFDRLNFLKESDEFKKLNNSQKKVITNSIRSLVLSGVNLSGDKRKRIAELVKESSNLSNQFNNNSLDAKTNWIKHITDVDELNGVPELDLCMYAQYAKNRNLDGYVITLDYPSISPIFKFANNRELRKEIYWANGTRASDQGPNANKWNNAPIIERMMEIRQELAKLLNFNNYAELSIFTKMANTTDEVIEFLNDLLNRGMPKAQQDYDEIKEYAISAGIDKLEPWDITYYSEKLKQEKYSLNENEIKEYFPVNRVLEGLFTVVQTLYGITVKSRDDVDVWHPDVKYYDLYDGDRKIAGFYMDLFSRPNKRGGAWMDYATVRMDIDGIIQIPVAYLCCNFAPPVDRNPSLLLHDDVETLFHEFGHGLHHMLTKVKEYDISGINGVEWDAVELPSQIMENWCWEKQALDMFAHHYKTNKNIPNELFKKMIKAKTYQSGLSLLRQLNFSLFDFRLNLEYDPKNGKGIRDILNDVDSYTMLYKVPSWLRYENTFSHIWSGGYAAGYYSYLWARMLADDAFSKFEETDIFSAEVGAEFRKSILEVGGSRPAMESFIEFRGRKPSIDAFLRYNGILIEK